MMTMRPTTGGFWKRSAVAAAFLALNVQAQPVTPSATSNEPVTEQQHQARLTQRQQARDAARQDIATQRTQINAQQTSAQKTCWQRFAVEDCLQHVRAQAREQEQILRERELQINDEERRERSEERLRQIEQRRSEPHTPPRMDATAREPRPPRQAPPNGIPARTPADIAHTQEQRDTEAQQRAANQAQRLQKHAASVAERQQSEADRRTQAQKDWAEKQQAAQQHRARKQADIANRTGQPLPIPQGTPLPDTMTPSH